MASLNKCFLIGNLTKDPTLKYMPNGDAVANISIATNKTWKGKDGSKQEKVEYHNLVMFRKLAEIAGDWLKKGMQIYVEGELQTRKWEKDGIERYTTEIVADRMQMLGGNKSVQDKSHGDDRHKATSDHRADAGGIDDMVDDIPF